MKLFLNTALGAILTVQVTLSPARADELPLAQDFRADAAEAEHRGLPILVFFSSHECPYCHIVQEDYLKPMFNSGKYKDKVLFRLVQVDDATRLLDFDGKPTTHQAFASRFGARLTPNVKFLDHEGNELVPGLLGLMTQDFYGGFLEAAIDNAVTRMRGRVALSLHLP